MEDYALRAVVLKVYIMSLRNLRWTFGFIRNDRCQQIPNDGTSCSTIGRTKAQKINLNE